MHLLKKIVTLPTVVQINDIRNKADRPAESKEMFLSTPFLGHPL